MKCPNCGKSDFDQPTDCKKPVVITPAVGDWVCWYPWSVNEVNVSQAPLGSAAPDSSPARANQGDRVTGRESGADGSTPTSGR